MICLFRNRHNLKRIFFIKNYIIISSYCNVGTMKYLNVAEKNDAAKNIAQHLSRGTSRRREGLSQYNKIYEFEADVMGQKCQMVMTSVSGHLLGLEFVGAYKNWQSCNPLALFDAPVFKYCPENYEKIKKTLEREIRGCAGLIIWTDCDREGENIGFEIIDVCTAVKSNLRVFRAKFSEITSVSVWRALQNLEQPNKNISDAVDVRQELDLRIGAAFTRFQTLRLQKVFPRKLAESLVSYGSCQFPTLGFVVERYRAVENFVSEPFWKLRVNHTMNNLSVDFIWERVRLFDQHACQIFHDICLENPQAKVCEVKTKPKSKWRPLPLDTVELEKLASRKLKINAKETMRLAEKLYTQGFISYPRTETNEFPKEMNLAQLVGQQTGDPNWGPFAQNILDSGGPTPRQGNKSDKAHPPIHPTKYSNSLSGNEQRLYEFIVRSFLACCSKDAQGQETTVAIEIANEKFNASGLMITARNYLEVYPYDKWSSKEIHVYENGQVFNPTSIDMLDGNTSPPNLLTEADLIALMEKHGIGTDATHAEHIETIKNRSYVALADAIHFVPGLLGMGLVEGYDAMGLTISKPHLRAQLEADLKAISEGRKQPQIVLAEQVAKYKEVYQTVAMEANKIDAALAERFSEQPNEYVPSAEALPVNMPAALKCPKCGSDMVVRQKKNNADELYISCLSYPNCKNAVWLPTLVKTIQVLSDNCPVIIQNEPPRIPWFDSNTISRRTVVIAHRVLSGHMPLRAFAYLMQKASSPNCEVCGKREDVQHLLMECVRNESQRKQVVRELNCGPNYKMLKFEWKNNQLNHIYPAPHTGCIGGCDSTFLEMLRINPASVRPGATQPDSRHHMTNNTRQPTVNTNRTQHTNNISNSNSNSPTNVIPVAPARQSQRSNTTATVPPRQFAPPQPASRVQNPMNNQTRMPVPRSSNSGGNTDAGDNNVLCGCNQPAILLTVRKQNANHGKQFYKCQAGKDNGGCDFFLWAPENDSTVQNPYDTPPTSTWNSGDQSSNSSTSRGWGQPSHSRDSGGNDDVMCDCGMPCKKITVQKEGPNKGRPFYCCVKDMGSRCNFFQWADSASTTTDWGSSSSSSSNRGRGRGRGGGGARGGAGRGSGGPRLCSLCRQPGHTRGRCPNAE